MPYEIKKPHIWTDEEEGITYVHSVFGQYVVGKCESGQFYSTYLIDGKEQSTKYFNSHDVALHYSIRNHMEIVSIWLEVV